MSSTSTPNAKPMATLYIADIADAPNPRRSLMFMAELGMEWTDIDVVLLDVLAGAHKVEKNPTGLLPFLELANGTVICESMAICRYLFNAFPSLASEKPHLYGLNDAAESGLIEMWLQRLQIEYFSAVVDAWLNGPFMAKLLNVEANPEAAADGERRAGDFLRNALEKALAQHEFVAGDHLSAADVSAFCIVDFAVTRPQIEIDESLVNVRRWYAEMQQRPSATSHLELFASP